MEEQNKERDLAGIVKIIDAILSQRRADVDEQNELNFMPSIPDDAEHPASTPIYWISKWVDYSDKYGKRGFTWFMIFDLIISRLRRYDGFISSCIRNKP